MYKKLKQMAHLLISFSKISRFFVVKNLKNLNQKTLGQKTEKTEEKHKNKGELENQHSSKYEISKKT